MNRSRAAKSHPVVEFLQLRRAARRAQQWVQRVTDALEVNKQAIYDVGRHIRPGARKGELEVEQAWLSGQFRKAMKMQRQVGAELIALADDLDSATNYEQRLQLICANQVDTPLGLTTCGIIDMVYEHDLEDSASRRGTGDYGPVAAAVAPWIVESQLEARSAVRCARDGHVIGRAQ